MGSDFRLGYEVVVEGYVSIHAPAWGATEIVALIGQLGCVSIHAPAWGATPHPGLSAQQDHSFNPRSRMGSDVSEVEKAAARGWFQSTLPHGERHLNEQIDELTLGFQSTLPHGERLNQ